MDLTIALYKAPGRIDDRIVRRVTRSPYSHVELVDDHTLSPHRTRSAWAVSSSRRDGGVRRKLIVFKAGAWDYVPVRPWAPADAFARGCMTMGAYDWAAILGTFCLPLRRHAHGRWTCSELVGQALGLSQPHLMSPGDLATRVAELNLAWSSGANMGRQA